MGIFVHSFNRGAHRHPDFQKPPNHITKMVTEQDNAVENGSADNYVVARVPSTDGKTLEAGVIFDFGDTLDEAVSKYGEEIIYDLASRAAVIKLQGVIRAELKAGKLPVEIETELRDWRPDVSRRRTRKDVVVDLAGSVAKMTDEEKAELLALLQR